MSSKVAFVGDSGVGKTSLINCKLYGPLPLQSHVPSVNASREIITVTVDNRDVSLDVWDTAGQDSFRDMLSFYLKDALVMILVCDVTNQTSFASLPDWLQTVKQHVPSKCLFFVAANKSDCAEQAVTLDEAEAYVQAQGMVGLFETSALTGTGVSELFEAIGKCVSERSLQPVIEGKLPEPEPRSCAC
jgi:small GTP-binding protein